MRVLCPNCRSPIERADESSWGDAVCPACGSSVGAELQETKHWSGGQSDTRAEPLESGRMVSHYRVLAPLGHGGMGVVYKAQDSRLGRNVALKFLTDRYARDPMV